MYFNSLQLRSNSRSFGQEIADKLAVCSILHELFSGDVSVTILVYDSSQVLNTRHQHVLILLHLLDDLHGIHHPHDDFLGDLLPLLRRQ